MSVGDPAARRQLPFGSGCLVETPCDPITANFYILISYVTFFVHFKNHLMFLLSCISISLMLNSKFHIIPWTDKTTGKNKYEPKRE